jgi:hypothetical protein
MTPETKKPPGERAAVQEIKHVVWFLLPRRGVISPPHVKLIRNELNRRN